MSLLHPTILERFSVGKTFLSTAPCVLRVALTEAKRTVYGEQMEAVVLPFLPKDREKLKKVLDLN